MSTFTTVVRHMVTLEREAFSIDSIIKHLYDVLLADAPRGAKCRTEYSFLENSAGQKFALATVLLMNQRGTLLDKALVYGEQPLVPGRRGHANSHHGQFIQCHSCKGDLFYDIGRSRDYFNHVCANCGAPAATLTETGASA